MNFKAGTKQDIITCLQEVHKMNNVSETFALFPEERKILSCVFNITSKFENICTKVIQIQDINYLYNIIKVMRCLFSLKLLK